MEASGAGFTRRLQHSWDQVKQTPGANPWDVVDAGLNTFLDEASDPDAMLNWVEPAQWDSSPPIATRRSKPSSTNSSSSFPGSTKAQGRPLERREAGIIYKRD